MPDEGGQYLLVQLIGVAKTMDFLMRKRIVSAEEALELGLVHEVVAPDQLMARTMALARELADGPQVAMRLLKRIDLQRRRDDVRARARRHRREDGDQRPPPGRARRHRGVPQKRPPKFNAWLEKK